MSPPNKHPDSSPHLTASTAGACLCAEPQARNGAGCLPVAYTVQRGWCAFFSDQEDTNMWIQSWYQTDSDKESLQGMISKPKPGLRLRPAEGLISALPHCQVHLPQSLVPRSWRTVLVWGGWRVIYCWTWGGAESREPVCSSQGS